MLFYLTSHFLKLPKIIGGATEKVLQFIILLKSIYHEIFVLMNKNVFLEHILLSKTFCILYNYIILVSKNIALF